MKEKERSQRAKEIQFFVIVSFHISLLFDVKGTKKLREILCTVSQRMKNVNIVQASYIVFNYI